MKRLSVSIFLLLAFAFMGFTNNLTANDVKPTAQGDAIVIITYGPGGITIPAGTQIVPINSPEPFTVDILPHPGFAIELVTLDDVVMGAPQLDVNPNTGVGLYTFPALQAERTYQLHVRFRDDVTRYCITASAGPNGTITAPPMPPAERCYLVDETPLTYTWTASPGYVVNEVIVNGNPVVPAPNSFSFPTITATTPVAQTIHVTFTDAPPVHYNITINIVGDAYGKVEYGTNPPITGITETYTVPEGGNSQPLTVTADDNDDYDY
jgi:hypothetical protein